MLYVVYTPEKEILELEATKLIKHEETIYLDWEINGFEYIRNEIMSIDLFTDQKTFIITNPKFLILKSHSYKDEALSSMLKSFSNTPHDIIFTIMKPILREIAQIYSNSISYITQELNPQDWCKKEISDFINKESIIISKKNLNIIRTNLNDDYFLIVNELARLSLANLDRSITSDIINEFSFSVLEADLFLFIESVMYSKKKKAHEIYNQLITEGSNPVSLLEMFATQIKFYYQVLLLSKSYKPKEIATLLKANPYRVSITIKSLNKISDIQILNKYKKTAELEYLSKVGKINSDIVFDLLI